MYLFRENIRLKLERRRYKVLRRFGLLAVFLTETRQDDFSAITLPDALLTMGLELCIALEVSVMMGSGTVILPGQREQPLRKANISKACRWRSSKILRLMSCHRSKTIMISLPISGTAAMRAELSSEVERNPSCSFKLSLTQINPFAVGAIVGEPKLNTEKPALGWGCNIYINYTVAQFKILYNRRSTIEQEAVAALIFNCLGLFLQIPAWRVCRHGERRRCLRLGRGGKEKSKRTKG